VTWEKNPFLAVGLVLGPHRRFMGRDRPTA